MVHVLSHKNSFLSVVNLFLRLEHSFCLHVNITHDIFNNFVLFSFKEIIKPVSPSELFPSLPIVQVCLVTFYIYIVILSYPFLSLYVCICDFVYEVLIKKEKFVHYFMVQTPSIGRIVNLHQDRLYSVFLKLLKKLLCVNFESACSWIITVQFLKYKFWK